MKEPVLLSGLTHWTLQSVGPHHPPDEKGKRSRWSHDFAGHEAYAEKAWKLCDTKKE